MSDGTVLPGSWRAVIGHDGAYAVSDRGQVRSVDRFLLVRHHTGKLVTRRARGRLLIPTVEASGHLAVSLGRARRTRIHRLVLEAFVGPCPDGMEGCHGDGDPANNSVGNLRWDTHGANMADRVEHGTHPEACRADCPRGHRLASPNLRADTTREGTRGCLACSRAKARVHNARKRHGVELDMQALSDRYYEAIMSNVAA